MTTSDNVPALQPGDKLTRDEFERRFDAMPSLKKAELLEGVVYMPSPVRYTQHGRPHGSLAGWLAVYSAVTPGVTFCIDSTLRLDMDNEPQPDLMLRIDRPDGQSRIDDDGCVDGVPELIVEVAASSVSYDLNQKLQVYRRSGVSEYVAYRTEERAIDWFVLRGGSYVRLEPEGDGTLRSEGFPGLWLDVAALLRADDRALHAAVTAGVASDAHAELCARLRS